MVRRNAIMPRLRIVLPLLTALLAGPPPAFAQDCLPYGPAVVTLHGTLGAGSFDGPQAYGEGPRGGARTLVLLLHQPICVRGDSSSWGDQETARDVRLVELVILDDATGRAARRLLQTRVVVIGPLVAGEPRRHRTPVLLEVKSIRAA
jgi:hypothetical protein